LEDEPAVTTFLARGVRRWEALAAIAAAALLGVHVWRAYALLIQAVSDPLHEVATHSVPLSPNGTESVLFVPECATAIIVRFDPRSDLRGPVHVSLALNEPGGRFAEGPIFRADASLEALPDGVWTLEPPITPLRGRFLKLMLRAGPEAHGSVLQRAGRGISGARPNLDQRWSMHASVIAGVTTSARDPMRCVATSPPFPRWLGLPAAAYLGAVWVLASVVAGWWLVGGAIRERP
jgi:hypothetical protein